MRIAGGLAAGAVVAGMIVAGAVTAPAARAAGERDPAAKAASAPAGVRSRYAELANAATGADLWSRSSVLKRPMGSVTKVMTAYVVLTTPGLNLNRVITVPGGIVAYDEEYDASTAGPAAGGEAHHAPAALRDAAAVRLRRRLHARLRVRAGAGRASSRR